MLPCLKFNVTTFIRGHLHENVREAQFSKCVAAISAIQDDVFVYIDWRNDRRVNDVFGMSDALDEWPGALAVVLFVRAEAVNINNAQVWWGRIISRRLHKVLPSGEADPAIRVA